MTANFRWGGEQHVDSFWFILNRTFLGITGNVMKWNEIWFFCFENDSNGSTILSKVESLGDMKLIRNHNHNTKAASPPLLPLTSPFLSLAPILLSYLENSFYLHSQLLHLLLCLLLQMHELLAHRLAPSTKICLCTIFFTTSTAKSDHISVYIAAPCWLMELCQTFFSFSHKARHLLCLHFV